VENQLIVPYVLGGELEVPPLVVVIGIVVGGSVAGILGVLLAVPIIATGREIFVPVRKDPGTTQAGRASGGEAFPPGCGPRPAAQCEAALRPTPEQ
jgi:hypothetical protein